MLEAYGPKYLEHPLVWPNTVEFRLYQKRIADAASERNTLVILPTAQAIKLLEGDPADTNAILHITC